MGLHQLRRCILLSAIMWSACQTAPAKKLHQIQKHPIRPLKPRFTPIHLADEFKPVRFDCQNTTYDKKPAARLQAKVAGRFERVFIAYWDDCGYRPSAKLEGEGKGNSTLLIKLKGGPADCTCKYSIGPFLLERGDHSHLTTEVKILAPRSETVVGTIPARSTSQQ